MTTNQTPSDADSAPVHPVAAEPVATKAAESPMSIAEYSKLYAVSRNPFGLATILPLLLFAFIGLEIGLLANVRTDVLLGGFMVLATGLLLIPAVVLRGFISFDDTGVDLRFGKQQLTASWDKVVGLSNEKPSGVGLVIKGHTQTRPKLRVAGGLHAEEGGDAFIPIRFFGDRRFAILYEIRDRLPEASWRPALQASRPVSSRRPLIVYGLTVLFGVVAMVAVAIGVTH